MFKSGKFMEPIYGFLFVTTEQDRSNINDFSNFSDRLPERLKPTFALLEYLFTTNSDDYSKELRRVVPLLPKDCLLVTDRDVRDHSYLGYEDSECTENTIMSPLGSYGPKYFMSIVKHNRTHHGQTRQEAFDNALATGIFGDNYYAQTPKWWTRAIEKYGRSESRKNPPSPH